MGRVAGMEPARSRPQRHARRRKRRDGGIERVSEDHRIMEPEARAPVRLRGNAQPKPTDGAREIRQSRPRGDDLTRTLRP